MSKGFEINELELLNKRIRRYRTDDMCCPV